MGPFVVVERIGNTAYHLDLSRSAALRGVHDVFHVLLLRGWLSNGVHTDVPSIEIDGEAEYEVSKIKGHREHQGEMQYLTSLWVFTVLKICGCLLCSWSMHLCCSCSIDSVQVFVTDRPLLHPLSPLISFAICQLYTWGIRSYMVVYYSRLTTTV